ncbi:hypothetical protein C8R47DRAFT_1145503 [Mycena vitilis]|nr:hypothetical protein C8R47DRAFT_1145503 [Mycena vitilis]
MQCVGCVESLEGFVIERDKVENGTLSVFSAAGGAMEFNFTGTAIYIFLVISAKLNPSALTFSLDGYEVGSSREDTPTTAEYNVTVYTNTSIPDGAHAFQMNVLEFQASVLEKNTLTILITYAVYTSNDLDSGSPNPTSSPHQVLKCKPLVGSIAGAGAVPLISMFIVGLIFVRRARRRNTQVVKGVGPHLTVTMLESKYSAPEVPDTPSPPVEPRGISWTSCGSSHHHVTTRLTLSEKNFNC